LSARRKGLDGPSPTRLGVQTHGLEARPAPWTLRDVFPNALPRRFVQLSGGIRRDELLDFITGQPTWGSHAGRPGAVPQQQTAAGRDAGRHRAGRAQEVAPLPPSPQPLRQALELAGRAAPPRRRPAFVPTRFLGHEQGSWCVVAGTAPANFIVTIVSLAFRELAHKFLGFRAACG